MAAPYEDRFSSLEAEVNDYIDNFPSYEEEEEYGAAQTAFLDLLVQLLNLVRDAEDANYDGLQPLVEKVDELLNSAVIFATDDDAGGAWGGDAHMPPFSQNEEKGPLVEDTDDGVLCKIVKPFSSSLLHIIYTAHCMINKIMPFFRKLHQEWEPAGTSLHSWP